MTEESISLRKKEHLEICSGDKAAFRNKSNGLEKYDFRHFALTEVSIDTISLESDFYGRRISLPFLISCMTGGTDEADNINLKLAEAAKQLNIPIGLGSLRYAIGTESYNDHLLSIREKAGDVPLMGNIGAAQIIGKGKTKVVKELIKKTKCDLFVIHLNPLQELLQKNGEYDFKGLKDAFVKITDEIEIPIIVKEVGSGIDKRTAGKLLALGVKGIDVAGAGGTSWAGVEILRNRNNRNQEFWDWGNPTAECIREVYKLKKQYKFTLIGSGGINSAFDAAKALALGADIVASARIILQELNKSGANGVVGLINNWFETIKKIMFLTGAGNREEFNKKVLVERK